jgi:hypothetical protein
MWWLIACFGKKTPPPPAPGTPEASLEARPIWASAPGYAPAPPDELLAHREEMLGPVDQRMLSCSVETTYRGDRQRLLASMRNHDTTLPDMAIRTYVRGVYVDDQGPTDSARASFGAPAVTLDEGDELQVVLSDQGFLRQVVFDRLDQTYAGVLPDGFSGTHSQASCWLVPQDEVEAALLAASRSADAGLALLASREVDVYEEDFGRGVKPDPRPEVEHMASLVGWERAEVAWRVDRIAAEERAFTEGIEAALAAELPKMPRSYSGQGLEVRSRGMQCPTFGYWRHGVQERCVIELEVERAVGGEDFRPQLLDLSASGSTPSGHVLPLELAGDRRAKAEWRSV